MNLLVGAGHAEVGREGLQVVRAEQLVRDLRAVVAVRDARQGFLDRRLHPAGRDDDQVDSVGGDDCQRTPAVGGDVAELMRAARRILTEMLADQNQLLAELRRSLKELA